jgi:hypothetical protein
VWHGFLDYDLPRITQRSAFGVCGSEFQWATAGRVGSKKVDHPSEVKISVHRRLLQCGVQNAQTIESGHSRDTTVQLPIDVSVPGSLGHKIEQSDWRFAVEVSLHDRDSEDPRDRAFERACANGANRYGRRRREFGLRVGRGRRQRIGRSLRSTNARTSLRSGSGILPNSMLRKRSRGEGFAGKSDC